MIGTTALEIKQEENKLTYPPTTNKFKKRLRKNASIFKALIEITNNVGNDLLVNYKTNEYLDGFRCDSPPVFDKILDRNATMIPIPIFLAYMPPVYFRVFTRFVLGVMDAEALLCDTSKYEISLQDLHDSLSVVDQGRFAEVIKFFIKYQLIIVRKNHKTDEIFIKLNEPYIHFYCGFTVSAVSTVAKTHMLAEKNFVSNGQYKWKEWKKTKPIIISYEDLINEEE